MFLQRGLKGVYHHKKCLPSHVMVYHHVFGLSFLSFCGGKHHHVFTKNDGFTITCCGKWIATGRLKSPGDLLMAYRCKNSTERGVKLNRHTCHLGGKPCGGLIDLFKLFFFALNISENDESIED